MKNWKFWDWLGYAALAVAAFVTAFDSALKNAPALGKLLPGVAENSIWAITPAVLVVVATVLLMLRGSSIGSSPKSDESMSFLPKRQIPKNRYEPESQFSLLPLHFTIDLLAQIPQIEVRFYVVSSLPRPIKLTEVELALQLYTRPILEDITFRQKDLEIDPKDYEVIICRRQLTDAERTASAWQAGRVSSASYQLSAKATDGASAFSYGPVSSKVIDGWINAPTNIVKFEASSARCETRGPTPLPNWTIKELFYYLRPSLKDGDDQNFESTGLAIKDKLSTGQLKIWGRRDSNSAATPLTEIYPTYWDHADFTYWFLAGDEEEKRSNHTEPDEAHGGHARYRDLQVSKEQAISVWPHEENEFISLKAAATKLYDQSINIKKLLAKVAEQMSGNNDGHIVPGSPNQQLDFLACHIARNLVVYGIKSPGTVFAPIPDEEIKRASFAEGAVVLRDKFFDKSIFWTDLAVNNSEFENKLNQMLI